MMTPIRARGGGLRREAHARNDGGPMHGDDAKDNDVAPRDDASNDNANDDADDNAKRGAKPRVAEG